MPDKSQRTKLSKRIIEQIEHLDALGINYNNSNKTYGITNEDKPVANIPLSVLKDIFHKLILLDLYFMPAKSIKSFCKKPYSQQGVYKRKGVTSTPDLQRIICFIFNNTMIQHFDIQQISGLLYFLGKLFICYVGLRLPLGWLWDKVIRQALAFQLT